jgi:hypothetical protein
MALISVLLHWTADLSISQATTCDHKQFAPAPRLPLRMLPFQQDCALEKAMTGHHLPSAVRHSTQLSGKRVPCQYCKYHPRSEHSALLEASMYGSLHYRCCYCYLRS